MTRAALNRARVLTALTGEEQALMVVTRRAGLEWSQVMNIAQGLMREGLAYRGPQDRLTLALTTAPHVEREQAQARALLEKEGGRA